MGVTKKTIADHLGISRTAVSLVLNNAPNCTVSQETRQKILDTAREMGYGEYDSSIKQMDICKKICFILYKRNSNDPRYMVDLKNIERMCSQNDFKLVFICQQPAASNSNDLKEYLESHEVEGAILTGDIDNIMLDFMNSTKVPYVAYGGIDNDDVNIILQNAEKIAYEAIMYLINLGHRKIALFSGSLDLLVHRQIMEGYKKALEDNNITFDKIMIQVSGEENGYELANRASLLDIDYTAVFCVNTIIQFGALQWLKEKGIDIPREVSILGYGMSELVKLSNPQLTTFSFDYEEHARVTFERLKEIMNNDNTKKKIYLTNVKFFEGGTVAGRQA